MFFAPINYMIHYSIWFVSYLSVLIYRMKQTLLKLTIATLALLSACEEEETIKLDPEVLNTSAAVIAKFSEWDNDGVLLVNHFIDNNIYHLITENDDTVKLSGSIVKLFQPNPSAWITKVQFTDGASADAPLMGNSLFITADSVQLNPGGYTPLSAIIRTSIPVKGKFKLRVVGKNGSRSDLNHSPSDFAKVHRINLFGLYGNFENTIELTFTNVNGKERMKQSVTITTAALDVKLPTIDIDVAKRDNMDGDLTIVSYRGLGVPFMPFIMDSFGDIRWYMDYKNHPELNLLRYECGVEQLQNGNLYFADAGVHKVFEIDFHGKIVNSWKFEGYTFHHNVIEKPNGNFIVAVSKNGSVHLNGKPTINDYIIELDRTTGAIIKEWDLKQCLDENRVAWLNNLGNANVNWLHNNGLYYDNNDNSLLITGRFQGMMKITADNKVKWILSTHGGWGTARNGVDLNTKLLKPLDNNNQLITDQDVLNGITNHADFEWAWFPHSPMVKLNGNFMVFDNGDKRNFTLAEKYSRAVEYQIDETNLTVKQVWQYGKERGIKAYSQIQSDVDFLTAKNNVLFIPGWNVDNDGKFGGKIIEVDYATREVYFEARISPPSGQQTMHRAERITIYR